MSAAPVGIFVGGIHYVGLRNTSCRNNNLKSTHFGFRLGRVKLGSNVHIDSRSIAHDHCRSLGYRTATGKRGDDLYRGDISDICNSKINSRPCGKEDAFCLPGIALDDHSI